MNWKILSISLIILGLSSWGSYEKGFGAGKKFVNDANQEALTNKTQEARDKEQDLSLLGSKIDQAYQEGLIDGDKKAKVLMDSLLNGSLRLSDPGGTTCPVPSNPTPTAKPDNKKGCQLSVQVTKDLLDLSRDAARNTEQLNGLIEYSEGVPGVLEK